MKAAVLGSPVAHSLSPALWRAAYAECGLDGWTYDAVECTEAAFPAVLERITAEDGWAGLSLTMPLKRAAASLVDRRVGRTGGAVNTILFTDDGTEGHNTDVDGVSAALRMVAGEPPGHVVVLGAGGTAAAAVLSAMQLGTSVTVVARNAGAASALRARTGGAAAFAPWTQAEAALKEAEVVVNTTPAGAADELAAVLPPGIALVDVLYDPWPTPLAAAATASGSRVVGGLHVLVHQAVRQIELVTGCRPSAEALLAAGEAALAAR